MALILSQGYSDAFFAMLECLIVSLVNYVDPSKDAQTPSQCPWVTKALPIGS